ncbi:MAG TPA: response regulator [Anaerolineae bacterium]
MSKIIVVDDDTTNAELIKMLLELDGFTVLPFSDVATAKEATSADTKAFVVDCRLARGANGLDLLTAVRKGQTAAPADAIVIMTSGDYRLEQTTLDAGADRFLLKPYSPTILSSTISELLEKEGKNG